ncbi:hypothetical protein [Ferrimonas kyonanensis]|uniref:hypothetical protein n=1 Tax=Ferrimonas kyonanensis TaxID=364763 RepID=UPI0012EBF490|nr:hypothetical protein [Ferrimonas kyonanensis]
MTTRKHPVSARLSDADFDLLMSVEGEGIHTQSDKLRELIRVYRIFHGTERTPNQAYKVVEDLLAPARERVFSHAMTDQGSPLLAHLLGWLPTSLAPLASTNPAMPVSAMEAQALQRTLELLQHTLRMNLVPSYLNEDASKGQTESLTALATLFLELNKKDERDE